MNAEQQDPPKSPRLRVRFSLKVLLLAMTVAAGFFYWWDAPRRLAVDFAETINRGEYEAASQMIVAPDNDLLEEWLIHRKSSGIEMSAEVQDRDWSALFAVPQVLVNAQIGGSEYVLHYSSRREGLRKESVTLKSGSAIIVDEPIYHRDPRYDLIGEPNT